MGDIAIRVDNLSKKYKIGLAKPHDTLRDQLADGLKTLFYRNGHQSPAGGRGSQPSDTVWALKDVSFEINQGEVVGIIGANGSGKSTLLKILSRITEPTAGCAEIRGRVGSLLEVGTGFHSELTGRENIYLNSAILGMRKGEIERKFDEIVAFSEVERFIDEPVKHYSSGMHVRLAFAVAAHLEPEVLIVDEVLAVGDVDFQKKCLGKMQDISKSDGRTILFVSHNMDSIQRLCSKCFMLKEGQLVAQGETASVVVNYLSRSCCRAQPNQWIDVSHMNRGGSGQTRFLAAQYSSLNEAVAFQPYSNGPLEFLLAIESDRQRSVGSLAITLYSQSGNKLVNADTVRLRQPVMLRRGRNLVKLSIKQLHLNPGIYVAGLWLANPIASRSTGGEYDHVQSAFEIEVVHNSSNGFGSTCQIDGFVSCDFVVTNLD